MKVISQKQKDGTVALDALCSVKEVNDAYQAAYVRFANKMSLDPEPGKTVTEVVEQRLGIKDLDSIVTPTVLEYLGPFAIDKRGITPAYPADPMPLSPLARGKEFSFRVVIKPKPAYELSSYEPVDIIAPKLEHDDSKVKAMLQEIAETYTEYVASGEDRPVRAGDHLMIKIESKRNGETFAPLTAPRRFYQAGEGYMPEGFEMNILGMCPGETKTFSFMAPGLTDDGQHTREAIECTVTVLELQVPRVPEITDEWVKTHLPIYGGLDNLVDAANKQQEEADAINYNMMLQEMATSEICKRFQGKIDDDVYEATMRAMTDQLSASLTQQGQTLDDYKKEMGGDQAFTMMMLMEVRNTLTQGYAMDAVFKHFKLKITDGDIDKVAMLMNPQDPEAARKEMESCGRGYILRESAQRMKAAQYLVDHANITYED